MTHKPAYHQHETYQTRLKKVMDIRSLDVDPYPHKFDPTHDTRALLEAYTDPAHGHSEDAASGTTDSATISGRLILLRAMGKNIFAHVQDHTGKIQVMFNRDLTRVEGYDPENSGVTQPPSHLKFLEKKLDLGDIIGIEGHLFFTQKGEITLFAKKVTLLCKTLLPLADKHAGLANKEQRYRKRWLDLISNQDVRETFRLRSRILRTIRHSLEEQAFVEVETPVLQSLYGGAEARPFTTNLHALDQDMYLRISLELPLKKLIVGGMNRVFEMGRVFRNEGIDRNHNPEFTLLEAYAANWDYHDMMKFVEDLFELVAKSCCGTTQIPYGEDDQGNPLYLNMKAPWPRLTMKDALKQHAGIDVDPLSDEEMRKMLDENEEVSIKDLKDMSRGLLISNLFEAEVEEKLTTNCL